MKAVGSCFTVRFRPLVVGLLRRTFASEVKPLDNVKPHARAGILSAVDKDSSGFPSYLILKETSPMLRSVSPWILRPIVYYSVHYAQQTAVYKYRGTVVKWAGTALGQFQQCSVLIYLY